MLEPEHVLVVLGCPVTSDGGPGPHMVDRLTHALSLCRSDPLFSSCRIVVTGGAPKTYGSSGVVAEGVVMQRFLEEHGIERCRSVCALRVCCVCERELGCPERLLTFLVPVGCLRIDATQTAGRHARESHA